MQGIVKGGKNDGIGYDSSVPLNTMAIKYIRDWSKLGKWIDIKAIDSFGTNVALNKVVTSNYPVVGMANVVDGSLATSASFEQSVAYCNDFTSIPSGSTNTQMNKCSNSVLNMTSLTVDPTIDMPSGTSFDSTFYKIIEVRYRILSGGPTPFQIFFYNSSHSTASEVQAVSSLALIADGEWHTYSLDMSTHPNWASSPVTGWRYDWAITSGITMDIDYIKLVNKPTPQDQYIQIDLDTQVALETISVLHNSDGISFCTDTKIEVSLDGTQWYTVNDGLLSGDEIEPTTGRIYPFSAYSVDANGSVQRDLTTSNGSKLSLQTMPYTVEGTDVYIKAPKGVNNGIDTYSHIKDLNLIASNIKANTNILGVKGKSTVVDTGDTTPANAGVILAGNSAYQQGVKQNGTMVNHTGSDSYAVSIAGTSAGYLYARPQAGYWSGSEAAIVSDGNFIPSNILQGRSLFGLAGTMPNYAGMTGIINAGLGTITGSIDIAPLTGYYDSASRIRLNSPDFMPSNIIAGKSIFGMAGTLPVLGSEEYAGWRRADTIYASVEGRVHLRIPTGAYLTGTASQGGQMGIFSDDPEFIASNIRNGANVFGLVGSYSGAGGGNAVESNVLAGKTFANADGVLRTGNIPNRAFSANGTQYTAPVSTKADGAGNLCVAPQPGYYNSELNGAGFGEIICNDPNFKASNIALGVSIFGVTGTIGHNVYSGTAEWSSISGAGTSSAKYCINIGGMHKQPYCVVIYHYYSSLNASRSGQWVWFLFDGFSQMNASNSTTGLIRKEEWYDSNGSAYTGSPYNITGNKSTTYPDGWITSNGFYIQLSVSDTTGGLRGITYQAFCL